MVAVLAIAVSAGFGSAEALTSTFSAWNPPVMGKKVSPAWVFHGT